VAQYDLERFVAAQNPIYATVATELRAGRKQSHWMWFVFPQLMGLGSSEMAQRYAIFSLDEARAYLAHTVLGQRLRECTALVLEAKDRTADDIFGFPDKLKFGSSMTLFAHAAPEDTETIFRKALTCFFDGKEDEKTVAQLEQDKQRPAR
jgi:uncharacterized protein (DUF1810 family)